MILQPYINAFIIVTIIIIIIIIIIIVIILIIIVIITKTKRRLRNGLYIKLPRLCVCFPDF